MIKQVKNICKFIGIDVIKYPPPLSIAHKQILERNNFNVVLDIGANKGFYAKELRKLGYKHKIISFEPIVAAYNELLKYANKRKEYKHIAINCALGEYDGETEINISNNSVSSSLLEATTRLKASAPEANYIKKQKTPVYKLDSILDKYCDVGNDIIYMKMDVQGYEGNILKGAQKSLPFIRGLQLEVSLVELYKDEILLDQMLPWIKSLGYDLHLIIPGFIDRGSGRLLQADCIFLKSDD